MKLALKQKNINRAIAKECYKRFKGYLIFSDAFMF